MDLADDPERTAAVIAELEAVRGAQCRACGRRICSHEALLCRCLGFLDAPRCLACLARGLEREPQALRNEVHAYLMHQTCLRQGWEWANREEGHPDSARPPCLWPAPAALPGAVE